MPITGAVRNSDGSVSAVVNGASVTLSPSDITALSAAPAAEKKPLTVVTASGRTYGKSGVPRYGIMYKNGAWHFLDKYGMVIPNTSWKARNLSRSIFTFNA